MSILRYYFSALIGAALALPSQVRAEPPASPRRPLLMLFTSDAGTPLSDPSRLAADLSERIEDLGVFVRPVSIEGNVSDPAPHLAAARQAPDTRDAVGYFTLIQSSAGLRFHLVLFDPKTEWSIERSLDAPDTETLVETLAVIIRTSLSAVRTAPDYREAATLQPPPSAPLPPTPSRDVASAAAPFYRASLSAGYSFSMVAKELSPLHGVPIIATVSIHHRVGLFGGYTVSFPVTYRDAQTELSSVHHPVQLGVSIRAERSRFRFTGRVAFDVNYIHHEYSRTDNEHTTVEQSGFLQLSAALGTTLEISILQQLGIYVAADADILLRRPRYLSAAEDTVDKIADPWPVMPSISLGVSWHFFRVTP